MPDDFIDLTAIGRYYKVYVNGIEVSQHSDEREAIERGINELFSDQANSVEYIHEYRVTMALTTAGITLANQYSPPIDSPPTINSTPSPNFSEGLAGNYDMKQHVTDDGVSTVSYSLSNILPNGLTFSGVTGILNYDGIASQTVSSHQLTATDAVGFDTSSSFNITVGAAVSFSAPPGYSGFITDWTSMIEETAVKFANGPTNYQDATYDQLADTSLFYAPAVGMQEFKDWAIRTGNTHNNLDAGINRAVAAYHGKYNRSGVTGSRIFCAPDVTDAALTLGLGGGDITVVSNDMLQQHTLFNFEYFAKYRIGPRWDSPKGSSGTFGFYGYYTGMSRPIAYLAMALCYMEKHGLARVQDRDDPIDIISVVYDCLISQLYRWRNEFLLQGTGHDSEDTTGMFMISMAIQALYLWHDWLVSQGEDPEQWFPSTVAHGNDPTNITFVTNPWTDTMDAIQDILIWMANPLDTTVSIDTTVSPHAASYMRVTQAHTAGDNGVAGSGGPRAVGDPMFQTVMAAEGASALTWHRSGAGGAFDQRNIQMLAVNDYYWMAQHVNGSDNSLRDRLIGFGDQIFYGAQLRFTGSGPLGGGLVTQQKARNQNTRYPFKGLINRDLATGRND